MQEFDITGFVNFPNPFSKNIKRLNLGKTFVYLVAIDFESSPCIYNCSFGLAEPGTFVTQECFTFLIEVVAAPQTASYRAPAQQCSYTTSTFPPHYWICFLMPSLSNGFNENISTTRTFMSNLLGYLLYLARSSYALRA